MDELVSIIKLCAVLFCIAISLVIILSTVVKIFTISELVSEKRAYDLIAEDEELEIEYKKNQEKREKEFHKERMELIRKQQRQVDFDAHSNAIHGNVRNVDTKTVGIQRNLIKNSGK